MFRANPSSLVACFQKIVVRRSDGMTHPIAIASSMSCCTWASLTVPIFAFEVSIAVYSNDLVENTM